MEESVGMLRHATIRRLPHFVYVLRDPRTNEPRYVGCSHNPEKRLSQHLQFCQSSTRLWVCELLAVGLQPILEIIGTAPNFQEGRTLEDQYLVEYSRNYPALLNKANTIHAMLKRPMFRRGRSDRESRRIRNYHGGVIRRETKRILCGFRIPQPRKKKAV